MYQKLIRWLMPYFERVAGPSDAELTGKMCMNTANMELAKGEYILLNPIMPGQCGPFTLSGNCLPVVEYIMFEKKLMEFVKVRAEVGAGEKVRYVCTIESIKTSDPANHGKQLDPKPAYMEPMERLIRQLFRYFPYCPDLLKDGKRADRRLDRAQK
jgi:hypothetical protein